MGAPTRSRTLTHTHTHSRTHAHALMRIPITTCPPPLFQEEDGGGGGARTAGEDDEDVPHEVQVVVLLVVAAVPVVEAKMVKVMVGTDVNRCVVVVLLVLCVAFLDAPVSCCCARGENVGALSIAETIQLVHSHTIACALRTSLTAAAVRMRSERPIQRSRRCVHEFTCMCV